VKSFRNAGETLTKRHNASPVRVLATELTDSGRADLVADFGSAGLWTLYDNTTWVKLHPAATQGVAAGGFEPACRIVGRLAICWTLILTKPVCVSGRFSG
jgi:hypothetical protein